MFSDTHFGERLRSHNPDVVCLIDLVLGLKELGLDTHVPPSVFCVHVLNFAVHHVYPRVPRACAVRQIGVMGRRLKMLAVHAQGRKLNNNALHLFKGCHEFTRPALCCYARYTRGTHAVHTRYTHGTHDIELNDYFFFKRSPQAPQARSALHSPPPASRRSPN